jgi:uncharacterized membrane protein (UPF0182 family)
VTQYNQGNGPLGPPPPVFRFKRRPTFDPGRRIRWVIAAVAALIVIVILANIAADIYANWLWFHSVGYGGVYSKRLTTRVWLFFAALGLFFAIFVSNLLLARRLAPATDDPDFEWSDEVREFAEGLSMETVGRITTIVIVVAGGLIGLIFASTAAGHWDEILLFMHSQSFGVQDPQFHHDLGFYVFKLPIYRLISDWLLAAVIVTIIGTVAVYVARAAIYGFRMDAPRPIAMQIFRVDVPRPIKLHVSALIITLLLIFVARYYLDTLELVYSTRGVELGAFYTDVHATLPLLYAMMGVAALVAVAVLVGVFRRGVALPLGAVALWVVIAIVSQIYPLLIQNFVVQPNEVSKEEQYLSRNIDMTRYAYGLDAVDERAFPASAAATADEVAANQDTINNVRLWDPDPLRAALQQIQTIRPLFQFLDVDVDRYLIDGKEQQVMLSARELDSSRLPADAQTWVNSRLQFTHGYGYTVAAVNEIEPDGTPKLLVSDIPLQGSLTTDHPEIYFGEQADHYIIVDGKEPEFTPASGGTNVETKFQGEGGVGVGSFFRRVLYAWKFKDRNILLSGAITGDSRIIYDRNIQQRIHDIAPFLQLDADPYMVVDQGNVYWMQDAYTTTDRIPYSHRIGGVNYIRNSVKVVVNAYSGETTFYAAEPDEPILKAYSAVFSNLFKPIDEMPAGLRDHIRYPEDMFRLQTQAYLRYHIRDARQFYQQEDQWDIPTETFGSSDQQVRPYYVVARLPGEQKEEFMLILPFVPLNRTNAIAWLAARSDGANYGKLVAFRFPSTESVPGPTQVERRIDSDGRVSQQLTLWNQSGSTVIRGNLLMIPIGSANMFFEPLYLAATGGANTIPQLKRVVVVNGDTIAMEPTLSRAIDVVFGRAQPSGLDSTGASITTPTATPAAGATPTVAASPAPTATPPLTPIVGDDAASLVAQAQQSYDRAQELLRNGDFAGYGEEIAHLKQLLDRLQQITGTPVASP